MTNTETTKTITVQGHQFSVTTQETSYDRCQYILTGKRGAIYGTMRNRVNPDKMFLITGRGFGIACGYEGVWLTDAGGELRVVS